MAREAIKLTFDKASRWVPLTSILPHIPIMSEIVFEYGSITTGYMLSLRAMHTQGLSSISERFSDTKMWKNWLEPKVSYGGQCLKRRNAVFDVFTSSVPDLFPCFNMRISLTAKSQNPVYFTIRNVIKRRSTGFNDEW
uniref:SET domain-containing protein n=1 Tax=Steinernema glaseri TaxID=37863 RepID=A0A1I7ZM99_9BILA